MKLKLSLLLFIIYMYASMWAQQKIHQFPASGSLYVPAGITTMNAQAWGAGGAGGAATQPLILSGRGGAGGGGGAYVAAAITVVPGATINTVVALQTAGSSGSGANGGHSTITNYETIISAAGGSGGTANTAGGSPAPGLGGSVAGSAGTTKTAGSIGVVGATGLLAILVSGAGGNAANTAGGGGTGGAGIASALGAVNSPGNPGIVAGGGGGGGIHTNPSASNIENGGAGARGLVILDYICTQYSLLTTVAANICTSGTSSSVNVTSAAANLPVGTYTVTYDRSNPLATGLSASMTVTSAGTGSFFATGLTNIGTSTITITNLASGDCTYPVTANNASTLTISPLSIGGAVNNGTTICSGSTSAALTLTGQTGSVVKWQYSVNPFSTWNDITNTATTYTSGPLTTTTQFRAVVQSGTCVFADSNFTTVTVNPLPTITLGTVVPVCTSVNPQNTTLAYTATTNTPTTYSIVWNASPANSFTAVTNTALTASPITIPVPAGTAPGTYIGTITVKNANTCTSSPGVNFNVVVNSLPTITLGAVAAVCTNVSAQSTTLAYSATTNTPTTYSIVWNTSPVNSFAAVTDVALPGTPITIDVPAGTGAGTYIGTITVKNANSCTSSAGVNFNVVVNPLPTITLGTVVPVCTSASAQNTTLAYTGTTNIPTTYSIVWNASPTNSFAPITNTALTGSPITITVPAGTIAGTYTGTVTVRNANTCTSSLGVNFNVVVNPLPSITLGTVTPVCTSAATQNTTLAYTGTTNIPTTYSIVWNTSPANSFATVINSALTGSPITIAVPAGTSAGTYTGTITVQNANTCTSSPGVNFNVLVNPLPSAPVIGTITHPTCLIPTGSISLSGLPAGGTLTRYPGAIAEPYSGTAVTILGLSANTYTFTANNGTCTSLLSSNAVVPGLVTNIYTTSWSNGTPTLDQNILFAGDFVTAGGGAGNINGCSCTVNPGVTVTVQFLDTLTLVNALTNNGGTVNFQNNSSFLQNTNAVNTGNISYKRTSPQITLTDFVYWSTPVSPQRLIDVSPLSSSDKFYGYNGITWVPNNPTSNMIVGKGYIIRAPNNYSNTVKTDYTASFVGVPNNGDLFGETVTGDGKFYLVGNPYPSALEANAFITANTFLDGTLYFWTHNTPVVLTGAYRYNADDYASYNLTGGVGIGQSALTGTPQNNNRTPNGKIAAGQSFFVSANSAGTIAFTNAMRSGGVNNSHFFKSANTSNAITEKHRVWLNMTNDGGAFKQTLVGYVEGASNNDESGYDGKTFDGNRYLDFYSINNDNRYVIQGRALPFNETDTVELGYRSTITGDFTISIDHADGDLINHPIYLEDKITNTIHDLQASSYTFSTSTGTFTDRFVLRYTNKTLGIGDFEQDSENVVITVQNKVITITSDAEKIDTVYIYDLSGKIIYKETNLSDNIVRIDNLKVQNQVLLVKVILDINESKIYKIIY
jgi:hypothetical protein